MKQEEINGEKLNLGDIVITSDNSPYTFATVRNLTPDTVTLFRPYVHCSDFAYTGGVICYIGLEEFNCSRNAPFIRVEKGPKLR